MNEIEWLKAIGTLAGGFGALIAGVAKVIEVVAEAKKKDDHEEPAQESK
ncbi:hypothetical protein [Hutsoniella sourekii]|nr:hypothetical protein [Hutsoniella sourekii]